MVPVMPLQRPSIRPVSVVPMWRQVADHIKASIEAGDVAPGDRLPAFRDLGESWGVGYSTMNRVLDELKKEGVLVSHPGKGIFVADAPPVEVSPDPNSGE